MSELHIAAISGNKETVELLLQNGADVNAKGSSNETPLHKAAFKGHKETVELLLQGGADVNAKNKYGKTPLHNAASSGNKETVELLLQNGADVNAKKGSSNETPLHKAAFKGHKETVELLLQNGADVNTKDNDNNTPLHKAARSGNKETVELLLQSGADVNAKGCNFDETPLHFAAESGKHEIVKLLIKTGKCDLSVKDNGNHDVFTYYIQDIEMVELLMEYGARYSDTANHRGNLQSINNNTQSAHTESKVAIEAYKKYHYQITGGTEEALKRDLVEYLPKALEKENVQKLIIELILGKQDDVNTGKGQGNYFIDKIQDILGVEKVNRLNANKVNEVLRDDLKKQEYLKYIKDSIVKSIEHYYGLNDSRPFSNINASFKEFSAIIYNKISENQSNKTDYLDNILICFLDGFTMYGSGGASCLSGMVNKMFSESCIDLFDKEEVKSQKGKFNFNGYKINYDAFMDLVKDNNANIAQKFRNVSRVEDIEIDNIEAQQIASVMYKVLKKNCYEREFSEIVFYGDGDNIFEDKEKVREFCNNIDWKTLSDETYKNLLKEKHGHWSFNEDTTYISLHNPPDYDTNYEGGEREDSSNTMVKNYDSSENNNVTSILFSNDNNEVQDLGLSGEDSDNDSTEYCA